MTIASGGLVIDNLEFGILLLFVICYLRFGACLTWLPPNQACSTSSSRIKFSPRKQRKSWATARASFSQ